MSKMKMTNCMQLVAKMSEDDQSDLLKRLDQYVAAGMPPAIAQVSAASDTLKEIESERLEFLTLLKAQHPGLFEVARAPAPAPEKPAEPDPLKEREAAAKAKMLKAAGKLADLLSKNTRANMLPEQEQALLPIMIDLFDGAMELGYVKFKQAARYVREFLAENIDQETADAIPIDTLQGAYIATARRHADKEVTPKRDVVAIESIAELADEADNSPKEKPDVPSTNPRVERDSGQPAAQPAMGNPVPAQPGRVDQGTGQVGKVDGVQGSGLDGNQGVPVDSAIAGGERSGVFIHRGNGTPGSQVIDAGAVFGERSGDSGNTGVSLDPIPASSVNQVAAPSAGRSQPASTDVKPGLESIQATLPQLLPPQQEDVLKAETRFAKPNGYGMLFTNGTGTGKTYSGLGVVKRFALQGKNNTLIVVPDDKIASDWIKSGRNLGLDITKLEDTKTAGRGIVITSYANLGENDELANRRWDLVVADEAHSLMQSADGTVTNYLRNLRAITHHPDAAYQLHQMRNRDDLEKAKQIGDQITQNEKIRNNDDTMDVMRDSLGVENDRLQKELSALRIKLGKKLDADKAEVAGMQGEKRARAIFLSATPFAYEKTIDWANGYLFEYKDGYPYDETSLGYNDPTPREHFFMQHLGYRKRVGKLTEPDGSKVDRGLMQRQLNGWMKKEGSLSGRMLDVPADYDRRFVLVDSAIGNQIDEALQWLSEQSRSAPKEDMGFSTLRRAIEDKFDYLSRRYLLEAIKATEVVPIVKAHMAMGRKVVVFHDYKKGGGFNPFDVQPSRLKDGTDEDTAQRIAQFNAAIDAFRRKFPDLVGHPFQSMRSPIEVFKREFDDVLLINGDEKASDLLKRYETFQDDGSGPKVMLVQSAKNKGWSGHDTTGKNQRVLINLGQPTAPTLAIQQEGRIYRTGQVSNAIMRYLNTGTNWEKWAFASTIAGRASTAENLGMGELSRALKDSFIAAFEESDTFPPGHEGEGIGGKERDKANNAVITEWDRAKTFYWATAKKTSKTKAQEGTDYFATPEPVGLKMVEWLDMRGGEDAMEPSGGHGAIARWLPETTTRTVIEPSMALRSRLAMVMNDGAYKILDGTFEDHNIVNKYDGIAMNPPFGVGGKTAIEHLAKAANHLRDGGRIVALIPTGPAADKRWEKWFYESEQRAVKPLVTHPILGGIYVGDIVTTRVSYAKQGRVVSRQSGNGMSPDLIMIKIGDQPGTTGVRADWISNVDPKGKRTEEYKPAADLTLIADIKLPQVTFERAGTAVATRIVVIEKQSDPAKRANTFNTQNRDYTSITDINDLFDRLENVALPSRAKAKEEPVQEPVKAEKPAKVKKAAAQPSVNVGDTVTLMGKPYTVAIYKTNAGKELTGAWVPTRAIALYHGTSTFQVKDKGWFVRERDFPKAGASDFDSSAASRSGDDLLSQYTQEEALTKQEREAAALKAEQAKPKAPQQSKLTGEQVDLFNTQGALFARSGQADTPEFKRWFGDSKVVDANGRPLVVYHGSPDVRGIINGGFRPSPNRGDVFFFTSSQKIANSYADPKRAWDYQNAEDHVLPLYLSMQNPMIIDAGNRKWRDTEKFVQEAKDKGHDGIIIKNSRDEYNNIGNGGEVSTVYAVFKPTQIKSAAEEGTLKSRFDGRPIGDISNNGQFDPQNPDIRFARGGSSPRAANFTQVQDWVNQLSAKWKNGPNILVVSSVADLRVDAPSDVRGLYNQGTVYIVAGAVNTRTEVAKVLMHEAIAHYGLREMLGRDGWNTLMSQIQLAIASGNKPLQKIQAEIRNIYVDESGKQYLTPGLEADEIAAKVVEEAIDKATGEFRPGFGFVKSVYAKIAQFLRDIGLDVKFTHAELHGALVNAMRNMEAGQRTSGQPSVAMAAARDDMQAARGTNEPVTNQKDVVGNQGGRSADDSTPGAGITKPMTVDPAALVFRESEQNRKDELTAETDEFDPIVVIDDGGELSILDGHNRASVAIDRGDNLEAVKVTREEYDRLQGKGFDDGEIAWAALQRANRSAAAGNLDSQFPGSEISKGGDKAWDDLIENEPTAPDSFGASAFARSPGSGQLRPSTAPMDTVLRTFGGTLAARLTSPTYAWLARTIDAMTPESIKAGVVSDYGLKEGYLDRKQEMKTAQRQHARHLGDVIDGLQKLDRQQSRVAYFWMQAKPDTKAEADMMAQLPPESRATLEAIKEQIDQLGQEAVKLGMISAETIERNRMAYLHRSYQRYETEDGPSVKAARSRTVKILGNQFKGRGLRDDINMDSIAATDWYKRKTQDGKADTSIKGEMFHRLERRETPDAKTEDMLGGRAAKLGKLREVVYWPVSEAIPRHMADWRNDGKWEARFFDKSGKVGMWRDFTVDERTAMGEIQEVRYGVAKTIMQMSRDVETARFLDWIAKNEAKQSEALLPPDAIALESASLSLLRSYKKDEWVQVPNSAIPGTAGLKRYGNLAGRWVPGPVWNDLRQIASISDQDVLSQIYRPMLSAWKISKTALSPATHVNNVMSNFVMADAHDIQANHILTALRTFVNAKSNPVAKETLEAFQDNGGDAGMFNAEEIKNEIFEPLLKQLESDLKKEAGNASALMMASNVLALLRAKEFRQAAAMIGETRTAKVAGIPFKKMIKLYGQEDEVFRLAAFIKAREDGLNDHDAGKFARESFLNYEINAPWIAALRKSWMPFIAFTYRAAPMMAKVAADKPWKIAKWMMVAGALNALGYMMSGGDEDKERALMPDEKSGGIWGLVPKMIRMPWNDDHDQPVYLDIRRWVPVGDVVDTGQSHSAIPLPPPLIPGGPMVTFGEVIMNTSLFTGQDITKATDTLAEKWEKVSGYLWKSFAPNLPGLPWTYSTEAIASAGSGKTDRFGREMSVPQALSSAVGVKLGSYPVDVMRANASGKLAAERSEIIKGMKSDGRSLMRKGLDQEEYDQRKEKAISKLTERTAEFEEKNRKSLGLANQQ